MRSPPTKATILDAIVASSGELMFLWDHDNKNENEALWSNTFEIEKTPPLSLKTLTTKATGTSNGHNATGRSNKLQVFEQKESDDFHDEEQCHDNDKNDDDYILDDFVPSLKKKHHGLPKSMQTRQTNKTTGGVNRTQCYTSKHVRTHERMRARRQVQKRSAAR